MGVWCFYLDMNVIHLSGHSLCGEDGRKIKRRCRYLPAKKGRCIWDEGEASC